MTSATSRIAGPANRLTTVAAVVAGRASRCRCGLRWSDRSFFGPKTITAYFTTGHRDLSR